MALTDIVADTNLGSSRSFVVESLLLARQEPDPHPAAGTIMFAYGHVHVFNGETWCRIQHHPVDLSAVNVPKQDKPTEDKPITQEMVRRYLEIMEGQRG